MSDSKHFIWAVAAVFIALMIVGYASESGDMNYYDKQMYQMYVNACREQGAVPEPPWDWHVRKKEDELGTSR